MLTFPAGGRKINLRVGGVSAEISKIGLGWWAKHTEAILVYLGKLVNLPTLKYA